jgi:uncharacterized protein (TIGR02246 family)
VGKPEDIHQKFARALNAGDLDGLSNLYLPDAILAPAPGQVVRGKAEIRAALAQFLAAKPVIEIKTTASFENGSGLALMNGQWTMKGTGPDGKPFEMSGKSAEILQKQSDGNWLYVIDNPFVP